MDKELGNREHERGGATYSRYRNLVIAVIILSMLLAGTLLVAINMSHFTYYYKTQLENQYERSFYSLTENMNDIELRLSKLLVSNSDTQVQKNLYNVSREAQASQMCLAELPTSHETINKTMRFINQLGDFCNYCADTLGRGEKLSQQQYKTLEELYRTNKSLTQELNVMASKLGSGLSVMGSYNNDNVPNKFKDGIKEIQDGSDFPVLDYEGPFADHAEKVEMKGLKGDEISQSRAAERISEIFGENVTAEDIDFVNETGGKIPTYNFNVRQDGDNTYVQITKTGGHPLYVDNKRAVNGDALSIDECVQKAEEFISRAGYKNVISVWTSDFKGSVYVNMAPVTNEAVIYSDMIKVIIARDNGEILGLETKAYLSNNSDRQIGAAKLSAEQAKGKLNPKIAGSISGIRLALIPVNEKEILTWEIVSDWEDLKYIVYLDASSGEEVQIFRVIESVNGTVLR